jgi:hypothetical protein
MFFACLKNNHTISMLWRPQPGNPQLGHKRIWRISNLKRIQNSPTLWCFRKPMVFGWFSQGLSQCLPHRPRTAALRTAASKMSAPLPGSPRQKMVLPEPDISTASPCRGNPQGSLSVAEPIWLWWAHGCLHGFPRSPWNSCSVSKNVYHKSLCMQLWTHQLSYHLGDPPCQSKLN